MRNIRVVPPMQGAILASAFIFSLASLQERLVSSSNSSYINYRLDQFECFICSKQRLNYGYRICLARPGVIMLEMANIGFILKLGNLILHKLTQICGFVVTFKIFLSEHHWWKVSQVTILNVISEIRRIQINCGLLELVMRTLSG